jgi:hypothetical protein
LEIHYYLKLLFQGFNSLQSTYRTSLCKLYDKDIRRFFENAKFKISGNKIVGAQTAGSSQVPKLSNFRSGPVRSPFSWDRCYDDF